MQLPNLRDVNVKGKRVFLRLDLDVPLSVSEAKSEKRPFGLAQGRQTKSIEDDTRLKAALPTIEYLLKNGAKIIIAGHLGRPQEFDKSLSLEPIAKWFDLSLKINDLRFEKRGDFGGWAIGGNVFLLENLRFYEGEEENSLEFSKILAGLADVYVNDAFAVCHRNQASITGMTKFLPHFAGLHLQREVEVLTEILENPKRPLAVIIGGEKLETKLPLVEKMHRFADYVLIGGKLAGETKELFKMQHEKLTGRKSAFLVADLNQDGTDITVKSVENFLQIISLAKTVVWNGPLGRVLSNKSKMIKSEEGTKKLAEGIIQSSAYVVIGGGDTIGFLEKICLLDSFACLPKTRSFLSTGGGAMLTFLSGEKLPGLEALMK